MEKKTIETSENWLTMQIPGFPQFVHTNDEYG